MTIYRRGILPNPNIIDRKEVRKLDEDLLRYLNELDQTLHAVLNDGITFSDNLMGVFVTFTSNAVANTEDNVSHSLGLVPTGFTVTARDKAGVLYNGGTADTNALIHLKSSVALTTYTIFVF